MFRVGPNPYGICTSLGIVGKASFPRDVEWYVGFAESIGARCIEFHFPTFRRRDRMRSAKLANGFARLRLSR